MYMHATYQSILLDGLEDSHVIWERLVSNKKLNTMSRENKRGRVYTVKGR